MKAVIRMDPNVELDVREPADRVEGNPPSESHVVFRSEDGRLEAGVWTCEPGELRTYSTGKGYPHPDISILIEGKLGVVDSETGKEEMFGPGDVFVTPKGSKHTWVVYEKMKKLYMVLR